MFLLYHVGLYHAYFSVRCCLRYNSVSFLSTHELKVKKPHFSSSVFLFTAIFLGFLIIKNKHYVIPPRKTHQFPHIKQHHIRFRNCPHHADTNHALPGHSTSSGEPVMKYRAMISGAQHAPTLFQTAITHPSWSVSYLRRITSCPVKSSVAPCSFS